MLKLWSFGHWHDQKEFLCARLFKPVVVNFMTVEAHADPRRTSLCGWAFQCWSPPRQCHAAPWRAERWSWLDRLRSSQGTLGPPGYLQVWKQYCNILQHDLTHPNSYFKKEPDDHPRELRAIYFQTNSCETSSNVFSFLAQHARSQIHCFFLLRVVSGRSHL